MRPESRDRIVSLATLGVVVAAMLRRPGERAPSPAPRTPERGSAEHAESPAGPPGLVAGVRRRVKEHGVPLAAAGVAFYAFLALVPAMIAAVMVFGLVADPADLERIIADLSGTLPDSARDLLDTLLSGIVSAPSSSLSVGLAVALGGALWSASSGTAAVVKSINTVFGLRETRPFVHLRALSGLLTIGAILLLAVLGFVGTALPVVLGSIGLGDLGRAVISVTRWPLLLLLVAGSLAVLYRVAPNRPAPPGWAASKGAAVAAVVWVAASGAFSFYVASFGTYNQTYGVLAGVIVLLLWFYLSALSVLLGAAIDAEFERRRARPAR
jgi:membrane protein